MMACDDEIGWRTTTQQPTNEQRRGGGGSGGGGSATVQLRRQLGGSMAAAAVPRWHTVLWQKAMDRATAMAIEGAIAMRCQRR
jgi:hypothetical protein